MNINIAICDKHQVIQNIERIPVEDFHQDMLFISDQSPLTIGERYQVQQAWCFDTPPGVTLTLSPLSVSGEALQSGFSDGPNRHTLRENKPFVVTVPVNIPYGKFHIPIQRTDTGRTQLFVAEIKNGEARLSGSFKTSGIWVLNSELLNSQLKRPMFSMTEHTFNVI